MLCNRRIYVLDVWVFRAFVHDPMCVSVGLLQEILAARPDINDATGIL